MSWVHASNTKYLTSSLSGIDGNAATVMLWIKKTASFGAREFGGINNGGTTNSRVGFQTATADGSDFSQARVNYSNSTGSVTAFGNGTGVYSLTPSEWACLVFRRAAGNDNTLYLNGTLIGTSTTNRDWAAVLPNALCLGRSTPGVSANADVGTSYAEFAVWDVALSSTVISTVLYTGSQTGKAANHADVGTTPIHYSPLTNSTQLTATIGSNWTENGGSETWSAFDHPTITAAGGAQSNAPRASLLRMLRSA
jgi:hypothetical protein